MGKRFLTFFNSLLDYYSCESKSKSYSCDFSEGQIKVVRQ
nr:MAG TPA: hypothetical protein [Caudoviricetes sp.]